MEDTLYKINVSDGEMYEIVNNRRESKYDVYWWGVKDSKDVRVGSIVKSFEFTIELEDVFRWVVSDIYMSAFYGHSYKGIEKIERFY